MLRCVAILFLLSLVNCEETCDKKGTCEEEQISKEKYKQLPFCDETAKPGHMEVDLERHPIKDMENRYSVHNVTLGGNWSPEYTRAGKHICRSRHFIAIIVPFRDREDDLLVFLNHIHAFMQAQRNFYTIIISEQSDNKNFNRGYLLNIGAMHAMTNEHGIDYDCLVMHDVDKFPEDTRNFYYCAENNPRHLIGQISYENNENYRKEPYPTYFGGVTSISPKNFLKVNGYSNRFFGWGSEDDDFFNRIKYHNLNTTRSPPEIGSFKEIYHPYGFVNPRRHELVVEGKEIFDLEGIRSMSFKMKRIGVVQHALYTNIPVLLTVEDPYEHLKNDN